jgi:hypothetical protein
VTLNEAAVTVPVVAGITTPPVVVRVPAGARITVPPVALTPTFPKFISTVFEMSIGVTIVAVAVAFADTCANVSEENPRIVNASAKVFVNVFIFVLF